MIRATISELQADLRRYLALVAQGEIVVLTDHDQPLAEIRSTYSSTKTARPIGLSKGTFEVPTSFFDPLPEELLKSFDGEE